MNRMDDLLDKQIIDDHDVALFLVYVQKARGVSSKIQYCDIFALKLLKLNKIDSAEEIMNYAMKLNTSDETDMGRFYMVLGMIQEAKGNYLSGYEYYLLWQEKAANVHGYSYYQIRCLLRICEFTYDYKIHEAYNRLLENKSEYDVSREKRFYENLAKAIVYSHTDKLITLDSIRECSNILNEKGTTMLQERLGKHRLIEDELDMKRAFYELKMVREKLLIEERV